MLSCGRTMQKKRIKLNSKNTTTALRHTSFELACCGCVVSEYCVSFASFDIVCAEFDDGIRDVFL